MTSKNFSSAKRGYHLRQTELLKRRLWPIGLTALMFFVFYAVVYLIVLSVARGGYADGEFLASNVRAGETVHSLMASIAKGYLCSYASSVITTIAALVLSLQGFAYLHQKNAIDFYESQPILRRSHFIDIITNSTLIYLCSYVATLLIALLLTTVYGAMNMEVIALVCEMFLADIALFFACYSIAALASMLTGNVVVAILATGVLFFIESSFRLIFEGLKSEYFQTYAGLGMQNVAGYILPFNHIAHAFGEGKVWHNLVVAIAFFALAYVAYRFRKNESAGSAVVFRPVRAIVKIAIAVLGGLIGAFILTGTASKATGIFFALFSVFITCCVMEIIYAFSFKALFKHLPEMFVAMALVVGILLVFMFDLIGYDSYLPNPARVENAIFIPGHYGYETYFDENGERYYDTKEYYEKHMHIQDPAAVVELSRVCRDHMLKKVAEEEETAGSYTVMFKTKLGRTITRQYQIPGDIDINYVNRIYADPGFKEGFYAIYHADFLNGKKVRINYENYYEDDELKEKILDADAFRQAYIKDLAKLDVNYAKTHRNIGNVGLTLERNGDEYAGGYSTLWVNCTVYEGFDETIAYLKKEGLYKESPLLSETLPKKIEVTVYPPAFLEKDMHFDTEAGWVEEDSSTVLTPQDMWETDGELAYEPSMVYTDPAKIREILDHAVITGAYDGAFDMFLRQDEAYTIRVGEGDMTFDFAFREGDVPDFVSEDFMKLFSI